MNRPRLFLSLCCALAALCAVGSVWAADPLGLTPGVSANVTLGQISNLGAFNTTAGSADISYTNSDLATRIYTVRLPSGYDPNNASKKYGLITYIDAGGGTLPASYTAALDAHDVIWIGGNNINNDIVTNIRRGVAIMGAFRMMEHYNIDPNRVYASGLSGGSRSASDMAYLRSDFFHGFIGRVGSSLPAKIPGFQTAGTSSTSGNYDADYEDMTTQGVLTTPLPSVVLPKYFRVALMSQYADFRRSENLAIYRYGHLNHGNIVRMVLRPGGHSDEIGPSFTDALDFMYHPLVDVIWDRFENQNLALNNESGTGKVVVGSGFVAKSGNVTEATYTYNSSTHGVLRLNGDAAAAESKDTFTWQNVSGILLDARLRAENAITLGQNEQIGVHIVPATATGTAASQPGFHLYWCYGQPYRAEIVGADGTRKTLATWQHTATHPMSLNSTVTSPQAGEGTVTEKTFWNSSTAPDYAGRTFAFRGEDTRIVLNSVGFQLTFNRPAVNLTTSYSGVTTATTDTVTTDPNETLPFVLQGFWSEVETALVSALPTGNYKLVLTNDAITPGQSVGNAVVDEIHLVASSGSLPAPPTLTVTPGSAQNVLSWAQIFGAMSYVVQRSDSPDGSFTDLATVSNTLSTYTDTTATQSRAYYYRVTATGSDGTNGAWSPVSFGAPNLPITNFGFETPNVGTGNTTNSTNSTWTLFPLSGNNTAGIAGNNSTYTSANNAAPQGTQVAYAQANGFFYQSISGFNPGSSYNLTYSAAVRQNGTSPQLQGWVIKRDTTAISTVTTTGSLASNKAYVDRTVTFPATAASHQLVVGGSSGSNRATALFDNFRLAIQPPATPTSPSVSYPSNYQVRLGWTDNATDETAYRIERSPSGLGQWTLVTGSVSANSTSYTDSSVLAGLAYDYRISAVAPGGISGYASVSASVPDVTPPVPTGLAASPTTTSANLTWTPVTQAGSYRVKRSSVSGGPYTTIASGLTSAACNDLTVSPGRSYYYVVSALGAALESNNSAELAVTTPSLPAVGNLTVTSGSGNASLTWSAVLSADGYTVLRATNAGGPFTIIASGVTGTSYLDSSAPSGPVSYQVIASVNASRGTYTDPSVAVKVISSGTKANQPIIQLPAAGNASATFSATPANFTPTTYSWSQVPDTLNSLATTATATFSANQTTSPQVNVTLPAAGVYQFQVTASDGTYSASRSFWVQVWERTPALNSDRSIGKNPGIAPPTSVRQLSVDPGPYAHPRLLFSRSDWAELSAKATNATEVKTAVTSLNTSLAANFDKTGGTLNTFALALYGYATGGYDSNTYTNTVSPAYGNATTAGIISNLMIGHNPDGSFYDALVAACYLAWIGTDPTLDHSLVPTAAQTRFTYLATLVAAAAKVELARNGSSAPYYDMALCYDLIYDWMTPQQQSDTRDYLYAIGYGLYNSGFGGTAKSVGTLPAGVSQNGDFPNLADGVVMAALAIEGEESSVSASAQTTYGPTKPYATGSSAWPYASPASVSNLKRQLLWNTDWMVTPWGFLLDMVDYFQLGQNITAPTALALARRGENQFVTAYYYQSSLAALYNLSPREDGKGMALFDHHDGLPFTPGPGQLNAAYVVKYMYPDDPMVDYVYRAFRVENSNALAQAIFGSDPGTQPLATVAANKNLALTKFDPQRAVAVSRNGWGENDLNLIFENRFDYTQAHMHAERNNFSLYALGRAWSSPPGYHCTINDLQATVLIQEPTLASDPATSGYIGQSPSSATQSATSSNFPVPPGRLLEVTEDPAQQWTLFAGDAKPAYDYGFVPGSSTKIDTGMKGSDFMYPGLLSIIHPAAQSVYLGNLIVNQSNYNPVQYALRSVFTVRGTNPYVIVIDDISKDGTPRNYRWTMPCAVSFGPSGGRFVDANGSDVYSSMAIKSGATPTEATLYHSPIDDEKTPGQTGLARLLVRDVSEQSNAGQPAIFLDKRPSGGSGNLTNLTYGWDNNSGVFTCVPSSRLIIERNNVVTPSYKVLLFPYRTGGVTPVTSWNADKTVLTVDQQNGTVDRITFDASNPDHRTRVVAFSRTKGNAAPTINVPSNLVFAANTTTAGGQPGATVTYNVTATDYLGNALTPTLSAPSGSVLPVGVNTVLASAADSSGQQTSTPFTVTVTPSAPQVSVSNIRNISATGNDYGITLSWPAINGATGYNVKRGSAPGGPYTTVSSAQTGTTFTDSNLTGTGTYYVVTALLNSYEGPASAEVALAPSTGALTVQAIGTAGGNGAYPTGNGTYLLTASQGDIGGFSEQCTFLSRPWSGDGSFTARVASVTAFGGTLSQFSKFGVMIRSGTAYNVPFAMSGYNPFVSPVFFTYRTAQGGSSTTASLFGLTSVLPPMWCRLVRSGNTFTSYYSTDGGTWYQVGTPTTVPVSNSALVGLAAAPQNTVSTSAVFDNVVFLGTPIASGTANSITLNWAGSQAAAFSVQRGASQNGPFQTIASGLTTTAYTDGTVSPGQTYYYTVSATGTDGGATVSPTVRAAATQVTLTLPPDVTVTTANPAGTVVTFSVSASDTIDGALTPQVSPASGTTFPVGVTPVTCNATNSNQMTASGTFNVTVQLLAPQAPGNLTVTPGFTTNSLTWSAATGASTYTIRRGTSPGGPYIVIASGVTGTSFADTGLASNVPYYYVVTSLNGTGESPATIEASGVPPPGTATKANNQTALDLAASWSPTGVPTAPDVTLWTGSYTNGSVAIGSGLSIKQLQLTSPSQAITINAGTGPLVLGSGGIDMSTSTQSLTLNAPITLSTSQAWNVATSRFLIVNGAIADGTPGSGLTFNGTGTVAFNATNTFSGPTTLTSGTLQIGSAGTAGTLGTGALVLNGGTLNYNRTDAQSPVGGALTATSGRINVSQPTAVFTLNATNLPAGSVNTLTTVGGVSGATFVVNADPTASLTFASNVAGLNLVLKSGGITYNALSGSTDSNNVRVEGGTFAIASTAARYQIAAANQTFTFTGGVVDVSKVTSFGFRVGGSGSATQTGSQNVTATQSGGSLIATTFSLGGSDTAVAKSPSYTLTGGNFSVTGTGGTAFQIGADAAGNGTSTFTFGGGRLVVPGTISGGQAGAKQIFTFTAGTLAAGTINATNLRDQAVSANGTFAQAGGVLAPGDDGTAGKTAITGAYSLGANATLAVDVGGTTQATAFQTGQYDYLTVSGTTALSGNLSVKLTGGFVPGNATTFTIVNSSGALSGAFANAAFGNRIPTAGGEGSFVLNRSGNTATLGSYLALLTPTNLVALPGSSQIALTWTAPPNAPAGTTYTVSRATSSVGPFTSIGSGLTATAFTDQSLAAGAAWFYVVSANYGGISTPSTAVATATTYTVQESWRTGYFVSPANSGTGADPADPDADGLTNLEEYAFGGNPLTPDRVGPSVALSVQGFAQITFNRVRGDVTYTVQGSADLLTWSDLAINPGTSGQVVTFTDTVSAPRRFLRVRLTVP